MFRHSLSIVPNGKDRIFWDNFAKILRFTNSDLSKNLSLNVVCKDTQRLGLIAKYCRQATLDAVNHDSKMPNRRLYLIKTLPPARLWQRSHWDGRALSDSSAAILLDILCIPTATLYDQPDITINAVSKHQELTAASIQYVASCIGNQIDFDIVNRNARQFLPRRGLILLKHERQA